MHLGDSLLQGTASRRRVTKLRKQLKTRCSCPVGGWRFGKATGHSNVRRFPHPAFGWQLGSCAQPAAHHCQNQLQNVETLLRAALHALLPPSGCWRALGAKGAAHHQTLQGAKAEHPSEQNQCLHPASPPWGCSHPASKSLRAGEPLVGITRTCGRDEAAVPWSFGSTVWKSCGTAAAIQAGTALTSLLRTARDARLPAKCGRAAGPCTEHEGWE